MIPNANQLRDLFASAAAKELLPRFTSARTEIKTDGSLVTEADLGMQDRITVGLKEVCPEYPIVGEETPEDRQRAVFLAPNATFWCLDPLDGTTNFACGVPFFSVSLALIHQGQPIVGAVYDPIRDELFFAEKDRGARLNGNILTSPQHALPLQHGIGLVDFKRLDGALAARLSTRPPYASQRSFGSVALDWCWVAAGRAHVYLHGKQKVWDYAAGTLILAEAGGRSATLEGESVFDGSFGARSAVAAPTPELFAEWQMWLGGTSE